MAIEDFTTYTEVDPNNRLTVTASRAAAVNADRDEDVYLYKDKGVDHFDALDIDFDLHIASSSLLWALAGQAFANTVSTIAGFASTGLSATIDRIAGDAYRISLRRGQAMQENYACSSNIWYYCTLERVAGNDSVSLKIYSDSGRTNLLATLVASGYGTVKWRYVYGFVNFNDPTTGRDFDGYVQNLDLKEVVVAGRSFGYIIG